MKLVTLLDYFDLSNISGMDVDIKGAIYEGLLEKTASSSDKEAGQYFTPRPLIRAISDVMAPQARVGDYAPVCGIGGVPGGGGGVGNKCICLIMTLINQSIPFPEGECRHPKRAPDALTAVSR